MPSWNLIFPVDSKDLCKVLDSGVNLEHYVIWLDEAQNYLSSEASSAAASLLIKLMLYGSSATLVIGTMWARYWQDMIIGSPHNQPDYSATVRRFLNLNYVCRINVPADFTSMPFSVLQRHASQDARLRIAIRSSGQSRNITQVIAGGVQLLDRYNNTLDVHSHAVITAAMDFRKLGYLSPITPDLLATAVSGYLPPEKRATTPDWFEHSIEAYSKFSLKKYSPTAAR